MLFISSCIASSMYLVDFVSCGLRWAVVSTSRHYIGCFGAPHFPWGFFCRIMCFRENPCARTPSTANSPFRILVAV
ncbi:uncharacterized protein J3R85_014549 [Psidium guajava]|nr:uncharacterized protein J3R85_014549 [Psidium guajava]